MKINLGEMPFKGPEIRRQTSQSILSYAAFEDWGVALLWML